MADTIRARFPDGVTALIDMVNREGAFARVADVVKEGGRIATTLGAADAEALAARGFRATNVVGAPTPEKLDSLAEQAAAGTLRVEVQQVFQLSEVAAALAAFAAGKRGKLVLRV